MVAGKIDSIPGCCTWLLMQGFKNNIDLPDGFETWPPEVQQQWLLA